MERWSAALVKAGADVNAADASGTTVLMLAAASGDVETTRARGPRRRRARARTAMEQTALMFAAATTASVRSAAAGARRAPRRHQQGRESDRAEEAPRQHPRCAGWRGRRGGRGAHAGGPPTVAGVDRPFQYNELVGAQGGLTPLLFAVRQGHVDCGHGTRRGRRRRERGQRRRQDQSRADGGHQRPFRSRAVSDRARRRREAGQRRTASPRCMRC